jgi:hypothetical protein
MCTNLKKNENEKNDFNEKEIELVDKNITIFLNKKIANPLTSTLSTTYFEKKLNKNFEKHKNSNKKNFETKTKNFYVDSSEYQEKIFDSEKKIILLLKLFFENDGEVLNFYFIIIFYFFILFFYLLVIHTFFYFLFFYLLFFFI